MAWQEAQKRASARKKINIQQEQIEMFEASLEAMNASPSSEAMLELFKQQLDIMRDIVDGYPTWADSAGYVN